MTEPLDCGMGAGKIGLGLKSHKWFLGMVVGWIECMMAFLERIWHHDGKAGGREEMTAQLFA